MANLYCEEIAIEGSGCIAVWKGGDRKPISGLTAEEFKNVEDKSKVGKKAPPFLGRLPRVDQLSSDSGSSS